MPLREVLGPGSWRTTPCSVPRVVCAWGLQWVGIKVGAGSAHRPRPLRCPCRWMEGGPGSGRRSRWGRSHSLPGRWTRRLQRTVGAALGGKGPQPGLHSLCGGQIGTEDPGLSVTLHASGCLPAQSMVCPEPSLPTFRAGGLQGHRGSREEAKEHKTAGKTGRN